MVTGGTGFLGSHLLNDLVRKHEKVVALKRPSSSMEEVKRVFSYYTGEVDELFRRIDWVDADLMNQADVEGAMTGVDRVFHCAGKVSFQPRDRQQMIRFNMQSAAIVVNACQETGVKKLLHVSSSSAIGRAPEGSPADESMIWTHTKSTTGYAQSKFNAEMEVWRGIEEGLNAVIVNPTIILGPGFWNRGSSSMFTRVARGLKYTSPGVTGYVGVNDVVTAMMRLMDSDISGERFIISEGDYSYREIFEMIGTALGVRRNLKTVSPSLMRTLVRLDALAGFFTRRRHITSEHIRAAFGEVHFSNEKIRKAVGMEFTPVEQVIREVAGLYRLP